jgi:hypothetical protein
MLSDQQGAANGRQPLRSACIRASAAAASRHSRLAFSPQDMPHEFDGRKYEKALAHQME